MTASDHFDGNDRHAEGRVVTFYSYKGGTGRSMTLINVAWILALSGRKVLVIDWDLEAPGLHRFLHPFLKDAELQETFGLLDYVIDLASASTADGQSPRIDVFDYITLLEWPRDSASFGAWKATNGSLDLLPAGKQTSSYSRKLASFDWITFYEKFGGRKLLSAALSDLRSAYDYILIDSRTGVSDTSGICTVEMPDTLVVCFTLNNQSIRGGASIASFVKQTWEQTSRTGRILPVPSRVEITSEKERREQALELALEAFAAHLTGFDRSHYWGNVQMPYFPFYAFEEIPAVFGEKPDQSLSLLTPLFYLTSILTREAVKGLRLLEDSKNSAEALRTEILNWHLRQTADAKRIQLPGSSRDVLDAREDRSAFTHSKLQGGGSLPGFQFDLYISYASVDLDDELERFMQALGSEVARRLGRWSAGERIFFDRNRLDSATERQSAAVQAVRSAALLIPIITPSYATSAYCASEFEQFLEGPTISWSAGTLNVDRLCPVLWRDLPQELQRQLPEAVLSAQWHQSKKPEDLAARIANALLVMRNSRTMVYLGESDHAVRDRLRSELIRLGFRVEPEAPSAYLNPHTIKTLLAESRVAIHFLGGQVQRGIDALRRSLEVCQGATIVYEIPGVELLAEERLSTEWLEEKPNRLSTGSYHRISGASRSLDQFLQILSDVLQTPDMKPLKSLGIGCEECDEKAVAALIPAIQTRTRLRVTNHGLSLLDFKKSSGILLYWGESDGYRLLQARRLIKSPTAFLLAGPPKPSGLLAQLAAEEVYHSGNEFQFQDIEPFVRRLE